jgi:DNA-directed RNA polymerase specialized sigma24 family protein
LPIEGHLRKRLARNELPGHSVKYIVEAVLVRLHDYFAWLSLDRKCRAVELRFFGGLSVEETAEVLKVSPETVHRDWRLAKAWLTREMGKAG